MEQKHRIRLVVKAARMQAFDAAKVRGVLPCEFLATLSCGDTVLGVPESELAKVAEWFVEDLGRTAPYPVGSLLFYSLEPMPVLGSEKGDSHRAEIYAGGYSDGMAFAERHTKRTVRLELGATPCIALAVACLWFGVVVLGLALWLRPYLDVLVSPPN